MQSRYSTPGFTLGVSWTEPDSTNAGMAQSTLCTSTANSTELCKNV